MSIENKFDIEEIVFLITDIDQRQRIVTSIKVTKYALLYCLACGIDESEHYDYEIASNKNYNI